MNSHDTFHSPSALFIDVVFLQTSHDIWYFCRHHMTWYFCRHHMTDGIFVCRRHMTYGISVFRWHVTFGTVCRYAVSLFADVTHCIFVCRHDMLCFCLQMCHDVFLFADVTCCIFVCRCDMLPGVLQLSRHAADHETFLCVPSERPRDAGWRYEPKTRVRSISVTANEYTPSCQELYGKLSQQPSHLIDSYTIFPLAFDLYDIYTTTFEKCSRILFA